MGNVVYRVVNAKGKPLKRRLRNGEQMTVVSTFFEQTPGGNIIPGDERLVIVVTPKVMRRGN